MVEGLALPDPFDAEAFIASLARERGRPIDIVPVTAKPDLPCGLVVTTDRADWIVYRTDTTAVHRQHILLHEAAHLVCKHAERAEARAAAEAQAAREGDGPGPGAAAGSEGILEAVGAGSAGAGAGAAAAAAASLMPHLPPDLIRNVLGRTVYSEPDEREAELVASLILQRARRRTRRGRPASRGHSQLDALFGIYEP
jgi:hypothetical protein